MMGYENQPAAEVVKLLHDRTRYLLEDVTGRFQSDHEFEREFDEAIHALEAAPVEVTERERLIDRAARTLPGWNDNTEDGDLTAHWERVNKSCRELVTPIVDAILAGFRAPAADGDSAQSRIDQHMQKIAHRVMDVFENAEEDTLADDIMQDVFEAIGLTESFGVESEEGAGQ